MSKVSGYQLLTQEQRSEMDSLQERCQHRNNALDSLLLAEYENLCSRLEKEYVHQHEGGEE